MPQPKKEIDENNILLPLYREYPAGLSTGELSELMGVSRITGRIKLLELQKQGKIKETGTSNRHIQYFTNWIEKSFSFISISKYFRLNV